MLLWGEIRCLSLIGVKGLKSHGHAEKKPRTIPARGKKCWETGSAAWYLFCIVFMVQYNTHNINYKSLLFGKVCHACRKKSVKKKWCVSTLGSSWSDFNAPQERSSMSEALKKPTFWAVTNATELHVPSMCKKLIDGKGKVTKVKLHNLNVYKSVLHILFVGNGLQTVSSVASRDDHLIPSVFFIFSSTCKAVQAS